jgi:uncharacterized protein DUF6011
MLLNLSNEGNVVDDGSHDDGSTGSGDVARIVDAAASFKFLVSGRAHATFVSQRTGARYTYRVVLPRGEGPEATVRFVSVLTAPDTYVFIGTCILRQDRFAHSVKSAIGGQAPSVRAFAWVWSHLAAGRTPPGAEVWHEGRCGRCGRRLTDPASIASGLGPICGGRS